LLKIAKYATKNLAFSNKSSTNAKDVLGQSVKDVAKQKEKYIN
jgi:hypothetical protein